MSATGSFDHRAIDGADGAQLMQAFKDLALFLQLAAIAIPLSLMADNHLWAMEAIGRQRYSVIVRMVVEPIVKITIAATLFLTIEMVSRSAPLAIAYAGGVASSAVLAWMFYRREVLRDVTGTAHERRRSRRPAGRR